MRHAEFYADIPIIKDWFTRYGRVYGICNGRDYVTSVVIEVHAGKIKTQSGSVYKLGNPIGGSEMRILTEAVERMGQ